MAMDFAIVSETDAAGYRRAKLVTKVSKHLEDRLRNEDFGEGVQNFYIGLIWQRVPKGFEKFEKEERAARYAVKESERIFGRIEEFRNLFEYDIKLTDPQYGRFVEGSESEAQALLVDLLVGSLTKLDAIPAAVNFDVPRFRAAVIRHLHELGGG